MRRLIFAVIWMLCVVAARGGELRCGRYPVALLPDTAERQYAVYLPDGFDVTRAGKYPVMYLLHGGWGAYNDWPEKGNLKATADSLISCGAIEPMVIVCPDGRYGGNTFWFDVGDWKAQQSFIHELIPYVEAAYNCGGRGRRAIGGLSLGGAAPLAYAVEFPDMFCAVTAMSSYIRALPYDPDPVLDMVNAVVAQHDTTAAIENADDALLSRLRDTEWLIDCGVDDFTAGSNIELDAAMNSRRICHTFVLRPGEHNWDFWITALPRALKFVDAAITR